MEIVKTELIHIDELAITMQEADKQSILKLSGMAPNIGLQISIANSLEVHSYIVDDKVTAISGLSTPDYLGDIACPWLLCSDEIRKHPRLFLESTRQWMYEQLDVYPILQNVVWVGHHRSIKWLKWLGFKLTGPYPIGINGAEFYRDEMRKEWVKQ